ncbi:hypothetical protein PIB30_075290 [Stylosanthes scabra]|uniref:Uncharacterized protein n=1 Tax=Stylosanthes scabra TaxID=79078 RepID=A0ABU6QQ18_9FABA|nr:hypothetical protein [Stylosanthes scabra]
MISFSPARQASPYQAGTSSHVQPYIPQTQEHTGLDELFQMTSYPSAEFTSIVETICVSRAQHVDHGSSSSAALPPPLPPASDVQYGPWIPTYSSPPVMRYPVFDPSRVGSEYATPPSYHVPSAYHSHSFDRHNAPIPTMEHQIHPQILRCHHPQADLTGPPDLPLVVLECLTVDPTQQNVNSPNLIKNIRHHSSLIPLFHSFLSQDA